MSVSASSANSSSWAVHQVVEPRAGQAEAGRLLLRHAPALQPREVIHHPVARTGPTPRATSSARRNCASASAM
jgi:hypothetical protein